MERRNKVETDSKPSIVGWESVAKPTVGALSEKQPKQGWNEIQT